MAIFKVTKGDKQLFPYKVADLENLTAYKFIWTMAATEDGVPILTKDSDNGSEIDIDVVEKDVNVHTEIVDFDYESTIEPGTYYCQLLAIFDYESSYIPRVIDKSTVIVEHSQYYKHQ